MAGGRESGKGNLASLSDGGIDGPVGVETADLRKAGITVLEHAAREGWTGEEFEEVLGAVTGMGADGLRRMLR